MTDPPYRKQRKQVEDGFKTRVPLIISAIVGAMIGLGSVYVYVLMR